MTDKEREITAARLIEIMVKWWSELKHQIEVSDKLLTERERVLKAIPACPDHGECVPHALEWIDNVQQQLAEAQSQIQLWDDWSSDRKPDLSPGDIVAAYPDGTIVLDDGITTWNPLKACTHLQQRIATLEQENAFMETGIAMTEELKQERDRLQAQLADLTNKKGLS